MTRLVLTIGPHTRVYLFPGVTDMRKGFDGLRAAVEQSGLGMLPQSGHLFGFANRRRNMVRFLFWDGSGFWICGKRLLQGTFWWPAPADAGQTLEVPPETLSALIAGLEPSPRQRPGWLRVRPAA